MDTETNIKASRQLTKLKETIPIKCPMAIDELISSLARCEMIRENCDDDIEKYFAKEAANVLEDIGTQMLTLASHPNIKQLAETSPNGL